ncbi:MAG: ribosome biogenesis GTPase YlqF [Lachnospiraceae bacterium]
MNFQWYPGHMSKAKRQMQEDIKLIDLIIELVDARIPLSSRNPDIDELGKNKARLILLNKADLADERENENWAQYFRNKGYFVVKLDSRNRNCKKEVLSVVQDACKEKTERDLRRGIKNRPVRAMVVGIPNVGKSTFINTLAGKAVTKTGNKPGVTKGKQWIRLNKAVELLDTPGILWPKFEDQTVGLKLALIGSIRDEILNTDELSIELIKLLLKNYAWVFQKRYEVAEAKDAVVVLTQIAEKRNCIKKGNELDYSKAAALVIDEFRSATLGRITLEFARDEKQDEIKQERIDDHEKEEKFIEGDNQL